MHALVRRLCAFCFLGATAMALHAACAGGGEAEGGGSGGTDDDAGDVALGGSSGSGGASGSSGTSGSGAASGTGGSVGGTAGTDASSGGADAGDASDDGEAGVDPDAGDEPIPCHLIPEECNGYDDNCNGQIDEGNPGGGGACTDPTKKGVCADGTLQCDSIAGFLICVPNEDPKPEVCNGLDDNCNGAVDENNPGGGVPCNTGLDGICAGGTRACTNGVLVCNQDVQPQPEVCNGLDDDCDGTPDNGFAGVGQDCTVTGQPPNSPCAKGKTNCLGGQSGCTQVVFPESEICDGKDNDCDGTIDNPSALDGSPCNTGLPGVCADGLTKCAGSSPIPCQPKVQPGAQPETCNGLDDNCDGTVDNVANIGAECAAKMPQATKVATWACAAGYCSIASCITNWGDCDASPVSGCETDLLKEATSCGSCGKICNSTNGNGYCDLGTCKIACDPGFGNCDGDANNGCETPLTAVANCGGCGIGCTNAHGSTLCSQMKCVPTCNSGWGNCDGDPNNGCETSTNTNVNNCGSCGTKCENQNGTTSCVGGACVPTCTAGFASCDGNPANGCETYIQTSITHCGGCNVACTNANGTVACINGACVPSCSAGSADCDGNPNNGCETNTNTNKDNCGACGTKCTNANGTTNCVAGACVPVCNTNFASCDGNPNNGCETNTNTNASHCGACGSLCTNPNGTTSCSGGSCVPVCNAGFDSCDGNAKNGCETNTNTNKDHCGACNTVCTNANGTTSCSGGSCVPVCSAGFKSCDGNPNNGCETSTNSNVDHCGNCNNKCTNPGGPVSCSGGVCQTNCNTNFADCDGNAANGCEINISNNTSHCGACNNACTNAHGTIACTAGACAPTCSAGWASCDGNLTNGCETSITTVANCGSCSNACTNAHGTTACAGSVCVPSCDPGWGNCDGNPANGCETPLNTLTNCGGCGTSCDLPNASDTCASGSCAISSCNAGWGNCDTNPANGCETPVNTLTNCGSCGVPCSRANATATCSTGTCQISSCNANYGNCDGSDANGCERNLLTNVNYCGNCGTNCQTLPHPNATGEACSAGSCVVTSCTAGYYNQNGVFSDGCECAADTHGDTCAAATDVGTLPVGSNVSRTGNLVPTGDSDWFRIQFQASPTCSYKPKVTVSAGGLPVVMRVYTACASGTPSGGVACSTAETGTSGSKDITTWEYNNSATCGDNLTIDPTPATGAYITTPATVWVRVFASGRSTSCLPFTLTFTN
jgi:hypothetical protein